MMDHALLHLGEDLLAKSEHGENIDAVCSSNTSPDLLEFFVSPLEGSVVHTNVDSSERIGKPGYARQTAESPMLPGRRTAFATSFCY